MANQHGYNQLYTDRPETWFADGYVSIGATGAPTFGTVPSGIVSTITRTGVGAYTITLKQNWYALLYCDISSEIPLGLTPQVVACQLLSDTVGQVASSGNQGVSILFNVAGTATELPSGSGFRFLLLLKRSSA